MLVQIKQYDPTRTTTLRNRAVRKGNSLFNELISEIKEAVVKEDVFALNQPKVFQTPGNRAYEFRSSSEKIQEFLKWIQERVDAGLLSIGGGPVFGEFLWLNLYIYDTYKRAVMRARTEMIRAGYNVPSIVTTGGIDFTVGAPYHTERIALLFTRNFNELKGITDAMAHQISRVLSQGFLDGDNPITIARKLVAVINGIGLGDLGITDILGRFIPAMRRAEILARTEIIRAYHKAAMAEYKQWAVDGLQVVAEFVTAGDEAVCPICAGLEGQIYTLEEAENLIPVHPQCRCIVIPIVKGGK
jgi:SPP1 gp7 family putative phage head morphogenesis protein